MFIVKVHGLLVYILAAPGYEITLNVVAQADDQITVLWSVPPGVQNQRLQYFDVIVEAQNTDTNQFQRERQVFVVMGQSVYTQVFDGLGWSDTLGCMHFLCKYRLLLTTLTEG